jgi:hypothetical protein
VNSRASVCAEQYVSLPPRRPFGAPTAIAASAGRRDAAAFVTWVGFPQQSVRIIDDQNALSWYQSSRQSRRGSCSRCGTRMFFESTAAPGETHIARVFISGPIDREPEGHTFFDQKVDWITIDDDLPKLNAGDPMLAWAREIGK